MRRLAKKKCRVFLVGFFLIFTQVISQAQTPSEVAFDLAAEKHTRELTKLLENKMAPRLAFPSGEANYRTVASALKNFPANTGLLFYDYSDETEQLRIWFVNTDGIQQYVATHKKLNDLQETINGLRRALGIETLQATRSPHRHGTTRATIVLPQAGLKPQVSESVAITRLTNILLPPQFISSLKSIQHLIVVAPGTIGTVPFCALRPFKDEAFLIDRMSVSYAPSLYELARNIDHWTPKFLPAVVVGNPTLSSIKGWDFPDLMGAQKEALTVARLINDSQPLIGTSATKAAVFARAGNAVLLYFATHGVADAAASLDNSFLALAPQQNDEGAWTMREIEQNSYSRTQLAVLSACQTGLGQVYDGGIMHLARTFKVAGVPRVVMSLWRVDDDATSDLMQSFIRHLQSNEPNIMPAEALRRAMVEVKKRRPKPMQWASFVLFGTPR
jgi:CHAT domain-containing protein